jgi:ribosomal protein S18 acetylase RimI-like enzyme
MNSQLQQLGEIKSSFSTRPATGQDLAQIASLTSRDENWVSALSNQLQNINNRILVAEKDDQLVGFIHFRIVKRGVDVVDGRLKRLIKHYLGIQGDDSDAIMLPIQYGLIQEIYVSPELRNRGIKKALIEACIEWSRSQQLSELQVELHPEEEQLISFYRNAGFTDSRVTIHRKMPERIPRHKKYIRPADQDDLPQLVELVKNQIMYQQSLANSFELNPDLNWAQYVSSINNNRSAVHIVAEKNNHLVGFLEAWIYQRGVYGIRGYFLSLGKRIIFPTMKRPEPFGVMEHIYVLPEFRNTDVAQNLVLGIVHWFRDKGVEDVLASIWANNESTLRIARVIGFKPIKIILCKSI